VQKALVVGMIIILFGPLLLVLLVVRQTVVVRQAVVVRQTVRVEALMRNRIAGFELIFII